MMVLLIQCLPPLRESDLNILMKIISYSPQEEYMIDNGKHKNKEYAIVRLRHANDGFLRPSMTSRVLQLSFPKPTTASSLVTMPPDTEMHDLCGFGILRCTWPQYWTRGWHGLGMERSLCLDLVLKLNSSYDIPSTNTQAMYAHTHCINFGC
jgi:hypothetical protein